MQLPTLFILSVFCPAVTDVTFYHFIIGGVVIFVTK